MWDPAKWKRLHSSSSTPRRFGAGALHFYMQAKADVTLPIAFEIAFGLLLGYRVIARGKPKKRAPMFSAEAGLNPTKAKSVLIAPPPPVAGFDRP